MSSRRPHNSLRARYRDVARRCTGVVPPALQREAWLGRRIQPQRTADVRHALCQEYCCSRWFTPRCSGTGWPRIVGNHSAVHSRRHGSEASGGRSLKHPLAHIAVRGVFTREVGCQRTGGSIPLFVRQVCRSHAVGRTCWLRHGFLISLPIGDISRTASRRGWHLTNLP